jgi:AcrR family transcriptional regulator
MTEATRQRLMDAALHLVARDGFQRTTVGDIERAAGLTARGGALYKHFKGKEQLLEAAVEHAINEVVSMRGRLFDLLPLDDLRSELTLLLRWLLTELERERDITSIFEKEGDAFPWLAQRFYSELAAPGYRTAADFIAARLNKDADGDWDADAVSVIVVGALVNYRRSQWNFHATPLEVDEERMVRTMVDFFLAAAHRGTHHPPPDQSS